MLQVIVDPLCMQPPVQHAQGGYYGTLPNSKTSPGPRGSSGSGSENIHQLSSESSGTFSALVTGDGSNSCPKCLQMDCISTVCFQTYFQSSERIRNVTQLTKLSPRHILLFVAVRKNSIRYTSTPVENRKVQENVRKPRYSTSM